LISEPCPRLRYALDSIIPSRWSRARTVSERWHSSTPTSLAASAASASTRSGLARESLERLQSRIRWLRCRRVGSITIWRRGSFSLCCYSPSCLILITPISFFPLFSKYIYALCNDRPALTYSTTSVLENFRLDGVVYLELRTTPRAIPSARITMDDYVQTILDCISDFSASYPSMRTNLILSVDRRSNLPTALAVVDLAAKYRARGVVAIDLCGDPRAGDVSLFAPAFSAARAHGLKCTVHFAESPQSSTATELWTLLSYQPDRIGHVIHVPADVKEEIVRRRLGLELCLSCNVHAKMITGSFGDHHFGWWRGTGCPIALSVGVSCILFHILSPNLEDISSIKIMSAFADYSRRTMSVSLAAACQMSMLS
jgi:hypothetical protein